MAKKFYKQKVYTVKALGSKDLNFLTDREQITEEDVNKILDDFFDDDTIDSKKTMETAWIHLLKGTSLTVENICITYN